MSSRLIFPQQRNRQAGNKWGNLRLFPVQEQRFLCVNVLNKAASDRRLNSRRGDEVLIQEKGLNIWDEELSHSFCLSVRLNPSSRGILAHTHISIHPGFLLSVSPLCFHPSDSHLSFFSSSALRVSAYLPASFFPVASVPFYLSLCPDISSLSPPSPLCFNLGGEVDHLCPGSNSIWGQFTFTSLHQKCKIKLIE